MTQKKIKLSGVVELSTQEMKDAKAIVSSSGSNFPLDAPCSLELD